MKQQIIQKIKQQIEAGIYPGALLRIIGMVNGLIATSEKQIQKLESRLVKV